MLTVLRPESTLSATYGLCAEAPALLLRELRQDTHALRLLIEAHKFDCDFFRGVAFCELPNEMTA